MTLPIKTRIESIDLLKGIVMVIMALDLWVVYVIWILVITLLYPLCKKFDAYKLNHKEKWWLSYL